MPRKRSGKVIDVARAIGDKILPPAIEHVAVGIGESVRGIHVEFLRPRLIAEDAGVSATLRGQPGRFDLRMVKRALLKIERTARVQHKTVERMMRVGRVKAMQHTLAHVGHVVPIDVFQKHEVRLLPDQHAAIPDFESCRHMQPIRKRAARIGTAVAVDIF